jgi:hypothetical protein
MSAVTLVSGITTGVGGTTLTAHTDPELYSRGFQTARMVVGCIGLVVMACMFVPESGKEGKFRRATPAGRAASPEPRRWAEDRWMPPGESMPGGRRASPTGVETYSDEKAGT